MQNMWRQTLKELRSSNWTFSDSIPLLRNHSRTTLLPNQVSQWKQIWLTNKANTIKWAKQGTVGLIIYSSISSGYFAYKDMDLLTKYMGSL